MGIHYGHYGHPVILYHEYTGKTFNISNTEKKKKKQTKNNTDKQKTTHKQSIKRQKTFKYREINKRFISLRCI